MEADIAAAALAVAAAVSAAACIMGEMGFLAAGDTDDETVDEA